MRKLFLILILLILGTYVAGAESVITVDVNESGNAIWTLEKRVTLTKPEITEWEQFIKTGQNISRYKDIAEFTDMIDHFRNSTENFSNRSMKFEDFNISFDTEQTISGAVGIIRYRFEWKNFSYTNSSKIYIGDAFSERMVVSSGTVLIIKIPEGYEVGNASPSFDRRNGDLLIWDGNLYYNFSEGEPSLILERVNLVSNQTQIISDRTKIKFEWVFAIAFILLSVALVAIWKKRHSSNSTTGKKDFREDLSNLVPGELPDMRKMLAIWPKIMQLMHKELGIKSVEELEKAAREHRLKNHNNINDTSSEEGIDTEVTQLPVMTREFLGYEERIEQYLLKVGGQAYQSEIVKESGLSKSKISMVLADMNEKGRIIKMKKGKENIIRLVND